MTLPLILCLVATVIPVFFGKISVAPTWLSLQALALGWISITSHSELSVHVLALGLEVLLVRAWLVPTLLRRALAGQSAARLDLMPSNLFAWGVAISLIILAFRFGDGARADVRALTLGVVAATVMIAFLILATNREPAAQLVGLLFMENALALFESLMPEPWALPVHLAVSGVYILTVAVGSWLVRGHLPDPSAAPALKEKA
jgi:hydrogenase-4 membrane subunit HyfE